MLKKEIKKLTWQNNQTSFITFLIKVSTIFYVPWYFRIDYRGNKDQIFLVLEQLGG